MKNINRREFLKNSMFLAPSLFVAGPLVVQTFAGQFQKENDLEDLAKYDFLLARVKFPSDTRVPDHWNTHPKADYYLLEALKRTVRCKVKPIPDAAKDMYDGSDEQFNAVVDFDDVERLCRFPFVYMTSEGHFTFTNQQKQNLKTYLEQGGFVLMDDCCFDSVGDYFFQDCFKTLSDVFGQNSLQTIPRDHEVFHNVFDLGETGLPFVQGQNHGARGFFIDNRLAVFLSSTDIHCGWADKDHAWFGPTRTGPGSAGHEKAIEMGVNIILYAMSH